MDVVEVSKAGLNCYIYTRVSTEIQIEGFSLSAQLQERINSLYSEMAKYDRETKEIEAKITKIKEAKYKEKQIFDILKNFNALYSTFDDEEKRTCLHLLIESIEIQDYETKVIDYSKIVKDITFRFYLDDNPDKPVTFHRTNDKHGETVCLLSKQ